MDGGAPQWRLWQIPVGIVATAVLTLALGAVPGLGIATGQVLFDLLLIAVPVAIAAMAHAASPRIFGMRRMRITPGRAALWIFLGCLLAGIATTIYYVLVDVHGRTVLAHEHLHGTQAVLMGLCGVTLIPVAEELFWRGFVHRGLRTRLPLGPAIAISSSLFGLAHWAGGDAIGTVPPRIFYGIVLALLLERTGSLYPGIVAHAYVNIGILDVYVPSVQGLAALVFVIALIVAVAVSVNDDRRKNPRLGRASPAEVAFRNTALSRHTRATGRLGGL